MNTYKTIDYKGMTIEVYYDECADSPREWDNLGTIYSRHRDYDPDNHRMTELAGSFDYWNANDDKTFTDYLNEFYYWLPISYYEHGGITVWAGEPTGDWDSGIFGVIAVRKDKAREEFPGTEEEIRELAINNLKAEIKTLDQWYTGEVYGFMTTDEDGIFIDQCGGYFGDEEIDNIISEAKAAIDREIEKREEAEREEFKRQLRKHLARRKAQIKNHAPLYARVAFAFDY